ncbi:AI-2E family transporter [Cochlodiniinecator piscidefendens]|uniref:AI-2E family transporter n=1 Tax=Cochlodiniinecator piscidefendens TaxID=2715756 RepID=UPI00140CD61F|nr:AI-2E family transporter [Cochlodiniinecator piscidefendens]
MGLPVQTQLKYWGIAAVLFFVVLWLLGNVIMPFLLAGAVAYFLDPVADRLEAMGLSRAGATTFITAIAVLIFGTLALWIVPMLINQAVALVEVAPDLFSQLQAFLTERIPALMDQNSTLSQSLASIGQVIQSKGGAFLQGLLSSAAGIINVAVLLVIVPVVAFYLLLDWDRMVAQINALLPKDHAPVVRKIAKDIDRTLASFIRGQGTVCLVLGTFYAVALMIIGLNYGLVAGFVAGLLTFIPYVGALVGGALAIGLGLFQFWGEWWSLGAVAAVFAFGQVMEGNVLTPKLVGSSVGLHPVWLIFALSAFGSLFGFVGMLVAVPVAASIGVIIRHVLSSYQDSRLFQGFSGQSEAEDG